MASSPVVHLLLLLLLLHSIKVSLLASLVQNTAARLRFILNNSTTTPTETKDDDAPVSIFTSILFLEVLCTVVVAQSPSSTPSISLVCCSCVVSYISSQEIIALQMDSLKMNRLSFLFLSVRLLFILILIMVALLTITAMLMRG